LERLLTRSQRLLFITCSTCGSHRSVQTIQAGFKAQVAKRRAMACVHRVYATQLIARRAKANP